MKLDSIEGIQLAFAFLLPGFVASWVLSAFTARKSLTGEAALLRYLALSTINFAVCYWPLRAIGVHLGSDSGWVFWGVTLVLSPTLIALAFAANNQLGLSQKLLAKNGKVVAGRTRQNSFASSINEERDLFVEEMWRYDCDTDTISAFDRPRSILLTSGEISTVEFSD